MDTQEPFSQGLTKERKEGFLVDYTIICDDQELPVHKLVLCAHSKVFTAAIKGPYKESNGTYKINDFPLCVVTGMIQYLYEGEYDVLDDNDLSESSDYQSDELPFHEAIFAIADKYEIDNLKVKARREYAHWLVRMRQDQGRVVQSMMRMYSPDQNNGLSPRHLLNDLCWTCILDLVNECPDFSKDYVRALLRSQSLKLVCDECTNRKTLGRHMEDIVSACVYCGSERFSVQDIE